ncbi:MAG: hypothetical protein LQ342_003922 [Letrouitia transgressa]|nr:MAG: hypothetical protein LQ342_003922 [Letrouitia transgressa]
MATHANLGPGNQQPICQNCTTSTTPLWRRDEIGSVLCNACGLFLKLHGTPRPISLKTDVIKSRNRVKSTAHPQKRKASSLNDSNDQPALFSDAGTPPAYKTTGKSSTELSNSPVSRTVTPSIHSTSNIAPQYVFEGASLAEHGLRASPSLSAHHLRQPSPSSTSSQNDKHLEPPQTYDQLLQANTALKTRVSELEVINILYKGQVGEQNENARRSEVMQQASEDQLRQLLEQANRRESELRRHVEELEREIKELREGEPQAKRQRVAGPSEYPDPSEHSTTQGMPV